MLLLLITYLARGPLNKRVNFIFPTKYVTPKSLKASHWLSQINLALSCQLVSYDPFHWSTEIPPPQKKKKNIILASLPITTLTNRSNFYVFEYRKSVFRDVKQPNNLWIFCWEVKASPYSAIILQGAHTPSLRQSGINKGAGKPDKRHKVMVGICWNGYFGQFL